MSSFSTEEKLDLLIKKIAFGKAKTETSENTDPFGEATASPLLLRGDKVWKEAGSIPTSPPGADTTQVELYTGADTVQCTAVSAAQNTNISGFKRSWTTGQTDWIPPEFGANYLVKVYVGPANWDGVDAVATTVGGTDGTGTGAQVFQVEPGNENAEWFFDYQAGILYWVNENESGTLGASTSLTASIAGTDKVYIQGYKYIGDFGVGAVSLASTLNSNLLSNSAGELDLDTQTANLVFAGPGSGADAAPIFRALVTDDLADDIVTLAKLQDITDERLLGRVNNSDGSVAELTKTQVLGMLNVADGANAYTHPDHTGDVTSTADGATVIASNAVTLAKMQQITTDSFLGRDTASDGNVEVLTATEARGILNVADGANNYVHPTHDGDDIAIDTGALEGATVISDLDFNITTDTSGHVIDANGTIATKTLTLSDLGYSGAADANNYAHPNHSGDVTSAADGATTIANGVVTLAKMANMATASLLGRTTAGTGSPEVLNVATVQSLLSVDDLITLSGVSGGDVNLGSFTGTVLSSSTLTTKGALQALATQVDTNSNNTGTTDLTVGTTTATSLIIASSSGDNVTVPVHASDVAGIITDAAQDIHGSKTFKDPVTIDGNLLVTGTATYVNTQADNVYFKDALITLGITDADTGTVNGTAANIDVGLEAYLQSHDGTASPTLVYDIDADYWAINNMDHDSSALTRIARTFKTAYTILTGDVTAGYFDITHNLHHEDIIVQVRDDATDQGLVIFKYQTIDAETVRISIGNGVAAGNTFNIVIVG